MTKRAKKIKLVDIDPDNWRSDPQVAEAQKHYVANSAVILASGYAYHNQRSRTFIIYVDETPVGMRLYYDLPDMQCYDLSHILIDERYQGNGYGKAATEMILDEIRGGGRYNKVVLCNIEGSEAAKNFIIVSVSQKQTAIKTRSAWSLFCNTIIMQTANK